MSEQNEVVIRKVHDGYLVELLDCPLAYTFFSQDEAERFIGPVWQRLDYVKDLYSQALRAENARLRGLLAEIQYDCEHIGGIQHLDKAERRTWVSVANRIKAALQPKEPSHE